MERIFGTLAFIFILVWAFRLEIGIAKANEALKRIEEKLDSAKEKR
jgi:hypothetical protein